MLTGTLPPEFGEGFPLLEELQLSTNALAGTFPPEWAAMARLNDLRMR